MEYYLYPVDSTYETLTAKADAGSHRLRFDRELDGLLLILPLVPRH